MVASAAPCPGGHTALGGLRGAHTEAGATARVLRMSRLTMRSVWLVALIVLAQVAVLFSLFSVGHQPKRAPVAIVAPPIVSSFLVDQLNALPGTPFDAAAADTRQTAADQVRRGEVLAAVVVDLAADRDLLLLSPANGTRSNDAITASAQGVSASRGRDLDVELVEGGGLPPAAPALYVLLTLVVGFGAAVIATWRRGPVETSLAGGVVRLRRFVLLSAAAAALASAAGLILDVDPLRFAALTFLLVLVAAVGTTALESLFDTAGLALATLLFVVTMAPMVRGLHPSLLPEPWNTLAAWLPHGAGLQIARALMLFDSSGPARSWMVLLVWLAIATSTVTLSRRARARAGVLTSPLTAEPAADAGRPS